MELHVTKRKGREIVVLLDNDMRIVKPVYDYLKYQDQRDRAINTLIAYGNDLKAFWEFLSDYGYAYDEVSPKMITSLLLTKKVQEQQRQSIVCLVPYMDSISIKQICRKLTILC